MTGDLFPNASAEFKLSITRALADQLAEALSLLEPAPLIAGQVDTLQSRPGVYELYVGDKRVYVGKASKDLRTRLRNHLIKLSGRAGIDPLTIGFLCLYVDEDLEAAAPETLLIKKYRKIGEVPWNTNGFGNKDPGRNRDGSLVAAKHFDALYPIDLMKDVHGLEVRPYKIDEFLDAVKLALPYLLRFDQNVRELTDIIVQVPSDSLTASKLLSLAVEALPHGWQATALPGYAILYPEKRDYRSALAMWRKEGGALKTIQGARAESKDPVGGADTSSQSSDEDEE
ncbi:hypothetical protein SAMN04488074_12460 [Lentzea albidocapillata subsp. violacea]|uniref:GIY-YIG domain-containing protein n=1 Tax=Lentzea albidocapillata subsp. violacea TaxID=128104 RepID=A0A1G9URF6_9PSEU|nr:hypothetical protein [Lentzea albidocapillata]SDM62423.1 hypothetical protein SAMN04488074_12460 [Lentzea albidocapillata subsp. violacea]